MFSRISIINNVLNCHQVSSRLELWGDELQRTEPPRDPQQAEQALAAHNESVARMQHATFQVTLTVTANPVTVLHCDNSTKYYS